MTAPTATVALKIGVVGKGGVGKTTLSGLLARAYADLGRRVVGIDTDSNPNFGMSLGLSMTATEAVPVLPRTMLVGGGGQVHAKDLIDTYGRATPAGVTLLSAIKVAEAGAGCTCSGHATVRSILADALEGVDVTLVDMEAGLEHLSRSGGTLAYADVLLVVCEPTHKSVLTAARTAGLAAELGIEHVLAVGNKEGTTADASFFADAFAAAGLTVAGTVPYDERIAHDDRMGAAGLTPVSPAVAHALVRIIEAADAAVATRLGPEG